MRKINNKNINGNFFIENFDEREEKDRVKIYDSDENYLDYLPIEEDDTPIEEQYNHYVEMLESFKTIEVLLDWLNCDYEFCGTKKETIQYLHEELNWDLPSKDYNPLDNEWVNRIGNIYIVVSEY
jgi:hypothetical protein